MPCSGIRRDWVPDSEALLNSRRSLPTRMVVVGSMLTLDRIQATRPPSRPVMAMWLPLSSMGCSLAFQALMTNALTVIPSLECLRNHGLSRHGIAPPGPPEEGRLQHRA